MMFILSLAGIIAGAAIAYFFNVLERPWWGLILVVLLALAAFVLDLLSGGRMGIMALGAIALVPMFLSCWLTIILLGRRSGDPQK
jgi:hypothetical protein